MFEVLFKAINEKVNLTEQEQEICSGFFISKKLRKKQYLLHQEEVCKYTAFVQKGVLRSFMIDDKGNEHIIQFAFEGWWINDMYSFLTSEPSTYNIDVLEEAEVLLLTKSANEALLETLPKMERYFRILSQNALIAMQKRVLGSLSNTAEEKYIKLLSTYPDILQSVPQHMIASYLGVTPETLSRVRKQISIRK